MSLEPQRPWVEMESDLLHSKELYRGSIKYGIVLLKDWSVVNSTGQIAAAAAVPLHGLKLSNMLHSWLHPKQLHHFQYLWKQIGKVLKSRDSSEIFLISTANSKHRLSEMDNVSLSIQCSLRHITWTWKKQPDRDTVGDQLKPLLLQPLRQGGHLNMKQRANQLDKVSLFCICLSSLNSSKEIQLMTKFGWTNWH